MLRNCGRPAEAVAFIAALKPQDTYREGLQQLDLAACLIDLDSQAEARQCIETGKQILAGFDYRQLYARIDGLEQAVA